MLIILFPQRFINYFYKSYQIGELKKKLKEKVEVHDISNIISASTNNTYKGSIYKSVKIFKEIKEWDRYLKKKMKKKKKIYILNCINLDNLKSFYIHYLLSKYKFTIIEANSAGTLQYIYSKTLKQKIVNFLKYLVFHHRFFLLRTKQFMLRVTTKFLKFNEIYVTQCGFHGRRNVHPLLSSKKTKFLDFNSPDYANFFINKKKIKNKNYAVFLDAKTPAFVGDKALFGLNVNYDKKKWYYDLNNFLKKVEKQFNLRVVIIPHPSVREFKNTYYDKSFRVANGEDATNKLISSCKFVLSISPTTAVTYCILYNKPITFIYNDQMVKENSWQFKELKLYSDILSSKIINLNEDTNIIVLNSSVNKKKYLKWKYNFITSKKTEKISNVEILNKAIFNKHKD
tara:strand:+ start:5549 stop:6745 length:1197 start_codon:yes stop_codon:yes gene_type:complete